MRQAARNQQHFESLAFGTAGIVEGRPRSHGILQEAITGCKPIGSLLHADGASSADNQDPGFGVIGHRLSPVGEGVIGRHGYEIENENDRDEIKMVLCERNG